MTEEQAVAWLLLEGFRLFRDPFDDDLRWCSDAYGNGLVPRTSRQRASKGLKYEHPGSVIEWSDDAWRLDEFVNPAEQGVAWLEEPLTKYGFYAPAVVKLLTEKENES